jgi:hypothetical protein
MSVPTPVRVAPLREPAATDAVEPVQLPGELAAALAAMRCVVEVAERAEAWSAGARGAALVAVGRLRDLVAKAEARVLSAEKAAGTWGLHGDRDLASFAGRVSHLGRGAGSAGGGAAATLAALPALADELGGGSVTARHVAEVTRAVAASPMLGERLRTPEGQAQVVDLAGRCDGAAFGKRLAQLAAAADPASRQRSHDEQRAARYLHLSHTAGGTEVKGRLDAVSGRVLAAAIEAFSPVPGSDDEREPGQRRADALIAVAERAIADRAPSAGMIAPVQAVITFTEATWTALRTSRQDTHELRDASEQVPGRGSAADVVVALRTSDPVTDASGLAWPASEVGRALCGCTLTRAVLDAPGQVLDLGRDVRLFGRAHWLALYAAGVRTCAIPGCGMPLACCQLHHIRWWDRDAGRTDLANCAPVCSFHHHEIHRHDLRVQRHDGGTYTCHHPDGRSYGGTPPGGTPPGGTPDPTTGRRDPTTATPHTSTEATSPPNDLLDLLTG